MFKEIGSEFYIDEKLAEICNKDGIKSIDIFIENKFKNYRDMKFLGSGRDAIYVTLQQVKEEIKKVAILPGYTCHTVIEPFIKQGYEIYFYELNKNLTTNIKKFNELVEKVKPSVVLVHSYFGIDTLKELRPQLKKMKETGVIIIEDITQSLFSKHDIDEADYYVASLRKWGPLPDGGVIVSVSDKITYQEVFSYEEYISKRVEAYKLKADYMKTYQKELKEKYMELFKIADNLLKTKQDVFGMSDISKQIISHIYNENLCKKRRENYQYLADNIDAKNYQYLELGKTDIPLFFTVYLEKNINRTKLQKYLANNNIFLPIIWPISRFCETKITDTTKEIYDHMISIPCDQRYDQEDMQRIIDKLSGFNRGELIDV